MGHTYSAVGWNRQKRVYDTILTGGIILYIALFIGVGIATYPNVTIETLLIRSLSTGAFILLHIVLSIGPLSRLSDRFLPLLYNRRHLGVSVFLLALAHAALSTIQFHGFGDINPLVSILAGGGTTDFGTALPFQIFGLAALGFLFMLAATSHDFWLSQLTAPVWKFIHMTVYIAYFLLVVHVSYGILQDLTSPVPFLVLASGALWIVGLHLWTGFMERGDAENIQDVSDGFVDVCSVNDIEENRAFVSLVSGERVAVFRYDGVLSAISNVCQHQNGPLGEGRIIDGLVTCPWHGYQYCPRTGDSPPPFTEKVPTFDVRIDGSRVMVSSTPNPSGRETTPAIIPEIIHA